MKLQFFQHSDIGKVLKANEDSCGYVQTPNGELFVVCDGMGGHAGGATASKIAVESICTYISNKKFQSPGQALNDALLFANMQILGTAREHPELKGMGTTACILLFQGDEAWMAHVGDSRIYLFQHKTKRLHRITKDHSLVRGLVDTGEIDDLEAENHPQKNIILKVLGLKETLTPEIADKPVFPATGDTFLICSDGLSDMVDDICIEKILQQKALLENKVSWLLDAAFNGGGKDNITVQLIQVTESIWKTSQFVSKNPQWRIKGNTKKPKNKKIRLYATIIVMALVLFAGGFYGIQKYKESHWKTEINKLIQEKQDLKKKDKGAKDKYEQSKKIQSRGLNATAKSDSIDMIYASQKLNDTVQINNKVKDLQTRIKQLPINKFKNPKK